MRLRGGRCRLVVSSVAGVLGVLAMVVAFTWQSNFDSVLASHLQLEPGSRSYQQWESTTVPLRFNVYLFNWTNADQYPDEIPNLEQLGPYVFREHRRKVNITIHENDSISYRTLLSYEFDEEASEGSLDDDVTTLDALTVSAAHQKRYDGPWKLFFLDFTLKNSGHQLMVTKSAGQLLFEGYPDLMLDLAKLVPSEIGDAPLPDRFGWFYTRNNSLDANGYMEVSAGTAMRTLPGQIRKWNYEDHLPYYQGICSELGGSVGEFLPRNLTEDSTLSMFLPEMCRTVHMEHVGGGTLDGLQYLTYAVGRRSFDMGSPENACFCNGPCLWGGMMNVSACRYGSPAFITLPHFLHGDPAMRAQVTGLEPDENLHDFHFSVEPKLGIPLDVAARFQLNFLVEANSEITPLKNVSTMLFPILWVEQQVTVGTNVTAELRIVRAILDWGAIVASAIAVFFATIVAVATCTNVCLGPPKYSPPSDMLCEKPKDETEVKLNPM